MTRIPSHTVEDAPPASRPLLEDMLQFSPTGRLPDALLRVAREASANSDRVSDATWAGAVASGWSDEQLAEAFAYLALTVFTSYFLNYAATELDIPASWPGPGGE
jgi:hypothetical protein